PSLRRGYSSRRLARYLRMLGFDALCEAGYQDRDLSGISARESRILLTRDRGLLKRGEVTYGYFVRATEPRRQCLDGVSALKLCHFGSDFQRCVRCNGLLHTISKESVRDRLPLRAAQCYDEFRICPGCDRLYWAGSHYEHMQGFVGRVLAACL